MDRRRFARLLAPLIVMCSFPAQSHAETVKSGTSVLASYRAALARLPPLGNVVFEYSEVRSGPTRSIDEDHRVYRNASGSERNETVAVDGAPVVPAIVRLSAVDTWPYDVRQFAVDTPDYNVLFLGIQVVGGRQVYGFSTVRASAADFSISGIYLDAARYLPVRETFEAQGAGCTGSGSITFGPSGSRWLPLAIGVSCGVTSTGVTFKETIKFSAYQFPATIPSEVFGGTR